MKICIDFTVNEMHDRHGGFGRYAFYLMEEILRLPAEVRQEFEFYALPWSNASPIPAEQVLDLDILNKPLISAYRHRMQRRFLVGYHLRKAKIDLYHSLHPSSLPIAPGCVLVATAHDIGELIPSPHRRSWKERLWLNWNQHQTRFRLNRPHHLIIVSQTTCHDIVKYLKLSSAHMTVIHQGVDLKLYHPHGSEQEREQIIKKYDLPPRWFINVGSDHARKNQWCLYQAWCKVATEIEEGLVLVGHELYGDTFKRIMQDAVEHGFARRVRWLQGVEDHELPPLYRGATAFVAPAFFEGFGVTPLEAMACGIPVLASRNPAHLEIDGNAALFFDPHSVEEISRYLLQISHNTEERQKISRLGLERAHLFTWKATALGTLKVYRQLLGH